MSSLLTVLSGGTGTPKLLQGLVRVLDPGEITVVVNTGEDLEVSGLHVSPDIDTVLYTLAGIVNEETWYGIWGDTFRIHGEKLQRGEREILRIGDRDREFKAFRTELLRKGATLSKATLELAKKLGVKSKVLPMSDDSVRTRVITEMGEMSFHEFWVVRRGKVRVCGVEFRGVERAKPAPGVTESIKNCEAVLIGPSNPVTSIGPILALEGIKNVLKEEREKVVAVSPIIGKSPVSGPAGVLMEGIGQEVSPLGVAKMYKEVAGTMVIHTTDASFRGAIERLGMHVLAAPLFLHGMRERAELARFILDVVRESRVRM